jgi:hypothetical protein
MIRYFALLLLLAMVLLGVILIYEELSTQGPGLLLAAR